MKRYGLSMTLLLIIGMFLTPTVLAAGNQWALTWRYDGSLSESLVVPDTLPEQAPELEKTMAQGGWKKTQEGHDIKYSREFASWTQYEAALDSLPVTVSKIDYIVWTMVEIKPAPDMARNNAILKALGKGGDVTVAITMPDAIKNSSGQIVDENTVRFSMRSFEDPSFTAKSLVYSRWFQWFEMGIVVMILGTMGIIIYLLVRMRRVDRLIEEEYSLEKVEEMILGGGEEQSPDGEPEGGKGRKAVLEKS